MKLIRLAPLLAALMLLAACQTPQVSPTIVELPSTGYARGIDMATDSSDVAAELQGRPWLNFVARYYRDPASRFPALSPSEAQRLSALGVKIVTVWEWHSSDPAYFTYATGYNDALNAHRQAKSVGQPPGSAIYFAVDFNARGTAVLAVDQYFRGVNAGLAAAGRGRSEYRIGVYGSGAVCAAIRGAGLAQYAWLTGSTAWDGTAGYNDWNIKQGVQGARFANLSFSHDANEARNDYGGFQLGNYASAAPASNPVVTVAAAAPAAAATLVNGALTSIVAPPTAAAPPPPPAPAPQPAMAPPATPMRVAAAEPTTAPAMPAPAAPAMARAAPASATGAAAEVAALAAAEPKVAAFVPPVPPRPATEPDPPPSSRRSSEHAVSEEPARERTSAHSAKASAGARTKLHTVAASSRAVAAPSRHHVVEPHETHKVLATRRSEAHATRAPERKPAAAHIAERSPRHHKEQR